MAGTRELISLSTAITTVAPSDWTARRLKSLCGLKSGDAITAESIEDRGAFPVYGGNGVRGYANHWNLDGLHPIIGRQGALCGNVHLVRGRAFVSEHAVVARPAKGVDPSWLSYALGVLNLRQYSQAAAQPGLAVERIGILSTPTPPQDEQELIVRYLDHAELRIAKAIAAKQAVVRLMLEARQALVSEIVTAGLVKDVVSRDTGVPGLGNIPEHWRTLRAKHVWRAIDVRSTTGTEERLTVSSSAGIVPRSSKKVTMFEAASYVGHKVVQPEDLVINSLWAWAGGLGVSSHIGLVSPVYGVYRLRPDALCSPEYMHNLLRSNTCQWQFQVRSKGIWKSRLSLTDEAFFEILLPIPPIGEQEQIASSIRSRTADVDKATDSVQQEISLLKEYRTRLISDVVTGKLDVREEAAKLPVIDPDELVEVTAGAGLTAEDDGDDE